MSLQRVDFDRTATMITVAHCMYGPNEPQLDQNAKFCHATTVSAPFPGVKAHRDDHACLTNTVYG